MPDLDDLIRDHLERAAQPPRPDPKLFHGIDRRRAERATRRRVGSTAMAIVILALFAGVALALSRSSGGVGQATNSASPSVVPVPPNGAIVIVFTDASGHRALGSVTSAGLHAEITSGPDDIQPAVNPAGDTVVFSRIEGANGTGGSGIYTVPVGGGRVSRLLDPSWFATDPAWSPDGTKIVFAGGGHLAGQSLSRRSGIYVMSADGRSPPKLVYAGKTDLDVEGHPSWSPDGSRLVFQDANAALSSPPNFDLYVINSDGSGVATDITNSPESETGPAWSPDGRRIAFSRQPGSGTGVISPRARTGSIATVTVRKPASGVLSGPTLLLTDGHSLDVDPAWSPDGKLIVFARSGTRSGNRTTAGQIGGATYILEVSTTGHPQTISTGTNGSDPFWQKAPLTPSPSPRAAGFATIPGVPDFVCNASTMLAHFARPDVPSVAYMYTRAALGPCPVEPSKKWYLALSRHGLGPFSDTFVFGPVACSRDCKLFGAPDLDGDRRAELAVVVAGNTNTPADLIELYQVVKGGRDPVFRLVTVDVGGKRVPFYFSWGVVGNNRAGVECRAPLPRPSGGLDFWTATNKRGVWHLVEQFATIRGSTMATVRTVRSTVTSAAALPSGGGTDFCGARVRP